MGGMELQGSSEKTRVVWAKPENQDPRRSNLSLIADFLPVEARE
jgi:hypothetical protein